MLKEFDGRLYVDSDTYTKAVHERDELRLCLDAIECKVCAVASWVPVIDEEHDELFDGDRNWMCSECGQEVYGHEDMLPQSCPGCHLEMDGTVNDTPFTEEWDEEEELEKHFEENPDCEAEYVRITTKLWRKILRERDDAIAQLKSYGVKLGEKVEMRKVETHFWAQDDPENFEDWHCPVCSEQQTSIRQGADLPPYCEICGTNLHILPLDAEE